MRKKLRTDGEVYHGAARLNDLPGVLTKIAAFFQRDDVQTCLKNGRADVPHGCETSVSEKAEEFYDILHHTGYAQVAANAGGNPELFALDLINRYLELLQFLRPPTAQDAPHRRTIITVDNIDRTPYPIDKIIEGVHVLCAFLMRTQTWRQYGRCDWRNDEHDGHVRAKLQQGGHECRAAQAHLITTVDSVQLVCAPKPGADQSKNDGFPEWLTRFHDTDGLTFEERVRFFSIAGTDRHPGRPRSLAMGMAWRQLQAHQVLSAYTMPRMWNESGDEPLHFITFCADKSVKEILFSGEQFRECGPRIGDNHRHLVDRRTPVGFKSVSPKNQLFLGDVRSTLRWSCERERIQQQIGKTAAVILSVVRSADEVMTGFDVRTRHDVPVVDDEQDAVLPDR